MEKKRSEKSANFTKYPALKGNKKKRSVLHSIEVTLVKGRGIVAAKILI